MIVKGDVVCQWVAEKLRARYAPGDTAVGWLSEGKLVAAILYTDYTGTSILMHSRVDDPKKVQREWLRAIFDYPFNQLGVKRVRGLVSSGNAQAIATNEHLGWLRESTPLADYFPDGDGIVYYMRREDCRWLDRRPRRLTQRPQPCFTNSSHMTQTASSLN